MKTPTSQVAWAVVLGMIAALYVPRLIAEGLAYDGLLYACVARNMAQGIGTAWAPIYTSVESIWIVGNTTDILYGQMPLFYWLQVPWFWAFGDHWWVEKAYDTTLMAAVLVAVGRLWRWQFADTHLKSYAWLPVLLLAVCPDFRWTCTNHVIEPSLTLLCLASIYSTLRAWQHSSERWALVGGLWLGLGVLLKGPVGLYPLVGPLALCLTQSPDYSKALRLLGWLLLPLLLLALGIAAYAPARFFVTQFAEVQLSASLLGLRSESDVASQPWGRLHIVWALLYNLSNVAVLLLVAALGLGVGRQLSISPLVRFWLLMGMAATVPFVLSPKQAAYYIVPALPCWILGISTWAGPWLHKGIERYWQPYAVVLARRWLMVGWAGVVVLTAGLLYDLGITGKTPQQRHFIEAFGPVAQHLPQGQVVAVPDRSWVLDPYLNTYLQRYHRISLIADATRSPWCLTSADSGPLGAVAARYRRVCTADSLVLWERAE